ncbi:hypothetical protein AB4Z40_13095 [Bosea sp. 2YAB26]|uniref:hypothetical protein n=1 Tax=Bosea sp. 2YAB26 TaxID=3237478 RepID=UPI003F91609F
MNAFAPISTASAADTTVSVLSLAEWQLTELDYAIGDVDGEEGEAILDDHSALVEKALSMPANSPAERAAQVRILLDHVMPASWLGEDEDLDWEVSMARRLLLKFAGLDPMKDPVSGE